jgi:hypothetical protein
MIGGGAYVLGKRAGQGGAEQEEEAAPVEQPAAPAAPAGGLSEAAVAQLQELGKLKEQGVLTEEEFDQQKKKILEAT